jgi:hypothetical protein
LKVALPPHPMYLPWVVCYLAEQRRYCSPSQTQSYPPPQ